MRRISINLFSVACMAASTAIAADNTVTASATTFGNDICYTNNIPVPCSQEVSISQKAANYKQGLNDAETNTQNATLYKISTDYKAGFDTGFALWGNSPVLQNPASPTTVTSSTGTCTAYALVCEYYARNTGRLPDKEGAAYWQGRVDQLALKNVSRSAIAAELDKEGSGGSEVTAYKANKAARDTSAMADICTGSVNCNGKTPDEVKTALQSVLLPILGPKVPVSSSLWGTWVDNGLSLEGAMNAIEASPMYLSLNGNAVSQTYVDPAVTSPVSGPTTDPATSTTTSTSSNYLPSTVNELGSMTESALEALLASQVDTAARLGALTFHVTVGGQGETVTLQKDGNTNTSLDQ